MITALILLESKAGGGNRTHDPLFTRQTLYLLSYADGTKAFGRCQKRGAF